MISDPCGVILAGSGDDEVILKSEIDIDMVKDARSRFPVLSDRLECLNKGLS